MEADESIVNLNPVEISEKILNGEYTLSDRIGRSKIWEIFSRIVDQYGNEITEYVFCKSCDKVFRSNKVSTSNLVKHKCYRNRNTPNETEIAISKTEFETTVHDVAENLNNNNNLTKLISNWVITNCRPYDLIHNDDLKAVLQEMVNLGSKFGDNIDVDKLLPSSRAVAKNVSVIYEQCFERVKAEISSIKENGFGLTSRIWTDSIRQKSYIVLTIHFLKNSVLTTRLLKLKALECGEKFYNQNTHKQVETILKDFDCKLSSKCIIVTDADNDTTKSFQNTQILPCISHLLNNALQQAVEQVPEVAEVITACVKLINFIKRSSLNDTLGISLSSYSPKRWNTIYKMLSLIENNWSEIISKIKDGPQIKPINRNHLKAIAKTLQPFEEAIETLEDDKTCTLHLVYVFLHELKKSCDTNDSEFKDLYFIDSFKENLRLNLGSIDTNNITTIHKLALFLYPPTNKLLQFSVNEKKCIESDCIRLMKCYKNEFIKTETDTIDTSVSKRKKLFSDFVEPESVHDPNVLIMQELQFYKNTRVLNSADFDVFSWWELQKRNFPLLYKIYCTVLATPATSFASQRIFNAAINLLYEKNFESGTRETEIEQMMFINSNEELSEI